MAQTESIESIVSEKNHITQYRAVLIGCGAIGSEMDETGHPLGIQTHAAAYSADDRIILVAVCDVDSERSLSCSRVRGVKKQYSDFRLMLAECSPDVVSIAVPTSMHDRVIREVLSIGSVQLILCEKPLAKDTANAEELVALAMKKGCKLLINYSRHYLPVMRKVCRSIDAGDIGTVRLVTGLYTKSLIHNGTHLLDLLMWWFGKLQVVNSKKSCWAGECLGAVDVVLQTMEGVPLYLHALDAKDYSLFEIDIIGSSGRISITDGGNRVTICGVKGHALYDGFHEFDRNPQVINDCLNDMMAYVVTTVVEILEKNKFPIEHSCFGEKGVEILQLAEEALHMAETEM